MPRRASGDGSINAPPLRYDNVTAGVFDCQQTLDSDNLDDFKIEDDSGWYAMQWNVTNQWLAYDLGAGGRPVGAVCLRWDDFKNITRAAARESPRRAPRRKRRAPRSSPGTGRRRSASTRPTTT